MEDQRLDEAIREEKRRYYREYRKKHKERIKANNARYWARRAEKARCEANAETITAE